MVSFFTKYKVHAILLAVVFLLTFVRLGSNDLSEWDEAYYASRAAVVDQQNEWLDQSSLAAGGLWAGSHPPLIIWMMALSSKVLGLNEWALRLPSALFGLATIVLVYCFMKELTRNDTLALLTSALLALLPFFSRLARMAQLDVGVLFWMMLSLYWFWSSWSGSKKMVVFAGLALGLGLMSKIIVAFMTIFVIGFFLLWEFLRGSKKEAKTGVFNVLTMTVIGILVALPWHLAITGKLGGLYWEQAYGYHVFSRMARPLEGAASSLGILFWPLEILNKLAGLFPFTVLGMLRSSRIGFLPEQQDRFLWSLFIVPFLAFSIAATKHHNYLLMFVIPLVMFAAIGLYSTFSMNVSRKAIATVLPLSIAALVWAQTQSLQRAFQRIVEALLAFSLPDLHDGLPLLYFVAGTLVLVTISRRLFLRLEGETASRFLRRSIVIAFVVPTVVFGLGPLITKRSDWNDTISYLRRHHASRILYVGTKKATAEFYLSFVAERGSSKKIISAEESGNEESIRESVEELGDADFLITEKNIAGNVTGKARIELRQIFETQELTVYSCVRRRN